MRYVAAAGGAVDEHVRHFVPQHVGKALDPVTTAPLGFIKRDIGIDENLFDAGIGRIARGNTD